MFIRRAMVTASVAAIASLCASSAQAFSQVVVFGDSLSDNGNLFAKFNGAVPAAPYVNGHFTNGKVAVEVLAERLGVPLVDYAIGGALTGTDNQFTEDSPLVANTGMLSQVRGYVSGLAANGASVDADALHVIWGGGNDFLAVIKSGKASGINDVISTGVSNLVTQAGLLYNAGARHLLMPLLPDLGTTYYATSGAVSPDLLSGLTTYFNDTLQGELANLAAASPGLTLTVFDAPSFLAGVRQTLADAGGDVTGRCWDGDYKGADNTAAACTDPSKVYLFDKVHPNSLVHQQAGLAMAASVVPEPATGGMTLTGLLMMGTLVARRRRSAV
jgi:phospholipase/lecithinase/hemolysin